MYLTMLCLPIWTYSISQIYDCISYDSDSFSFMTDIPLFIAAHFIPEKQ